MLTGVCRQQAASCPFPARVDVQGPPAKLCGSLLPGQPLPDASASLRAQPSQLLCGQIPFRSLYASSPEIATIGIICLAPLSVDDMTCLACWHSVMQASASDISISLQCHISDDGIFLWLGLRCSYVFAWACSRRDLTKGPVMLASAH